MSSYLVLCGGDAPAVMVGPFPEGYNALKEFDAPPPYHTVFEFDTREEAESEVQWHRENSHV